LVTVTVALAGVEVARLQVAGVLVALDSVAELPPTVMVEPTSCSAEVPLGCLLHGDKALQVGVHVDLLLDRSKFDQLLRKLIGIERIERILVLQLRGQELQERVEIAGQLLRGVRPGGLSGR
jgi:hypothetical protein